MPSFFGISSMGGGGGGGKERISSEFSKDDSEETDLGLLISMYTGDWCLMYLRSLGSC